MGKHTEGSIIDYATKVEELFRLKTIQLVRGNDDIPWGTALMKVVKEEAYEWEHHRGLLQPVRGPVRLSPNGDLPRSEPQKRPYPQPSAAPQGKKGKSKGKGDKTEAKRTWKVSTYGDDNIEICRRFNDNRGCKGVCPQGHAHACNVVLKSGKVCAAKPHSKLTHREDSHGAVATWE